MDKSQILQELQALQRNLNALVSRLESEIPESQIPGDLQVARNCLLHASQLLREGPDKKQAGLNYLQEAIGQLNADEGICQLAYVQGLLIGTYEIWQESEPLYQTRQLLFSNLQDAVRRINQTGYVDNPVARTEA